MTKVAVLLLLVLAQTYAGLAGTLWCGMGKNPDNDNELGEYADVDSCCRDHDKCDRSVEAFAKKYEYRNWRPYTLSDCECDTPLDGWNIVEKMNKPKSA
eukprot:gene3167-1472_t